MKKGLKTFSLSALKSSRLLVALAAVCTLGLFNNAQAQDAAAADTTSSKLTIGIRTGVNVNEFRVSGKGNLTNPSAGAQAGAFVNYSFTNWVSESLEVAWSQTGAKNFSAADGRKHGFYINNVQANLLSYFKIPVLSVYEPKFILGPSFNFGTFAAGTVEGPSNVAPGQYVRYTNDATNYFKTLDFGMIVGTGVDFNLKFAKLMLDVRYRHGISDINNRFGSGTFRNATIRTNQLSFQAGIGFSL